MHLSSPAKKLIVIFILFLGALFISLPSRNLNLKLGLDLAGGSHLVFEADTSKISSDKIKDAVVSLKEVVEKRVNLFGISEPVVQTSSFEGRERIIVELPGIQNTQEAAILIGKTAQLTFAEVQDLPAQAGASPSATLAPTDLTGADLERASVDFDQTTGKPVVALKFTKEGGEKFEDISERNIDRQVPIILDDAIISMPVVKEKISGDAFISGDFTIKEAKELVIQLNAGALPLPIVLVEERVVQASLGAESVSQSVKAGLVGLVMVLTFMVLSYGRLGVVSAVGLIIFGVLTLSLYKLIPVVLTLPGIAGFLLSVGMAVDSNILIFERFKEEKGRRPIPDALEVSFGRAWDSIRDANIATLVTAFILANPFDWNFLHTSGPVRGFAITLALGVAISLFTGIVVSRNLLRVFIKEKKT